MLKNLLILFLSLPCYLLVAQNSQKLYVFDEVEAFDDFYQKKFRSLLFDSTSYPAGTINYPLVLLASSQVSDDRIKDLEKGTNPYAKKSSPFENEENFALAQSYFYSGEERKASIYHTKVNPGQLASSDQAQYYYFSAVKHLTAGTMQSAEKNIQMARKLGYSDQADLAYLQGVLSFQQGDGQVALEHFEVARQKSGYLPAIEYYSARVSFSNQAYPEVLRKISPYLKEEITLIQGAMYELAGFTYLELNAYKKAQEMLELALRRQDRSPSASLLFTAGRSSQLNGKEDRAIELFRAAGLKDGAFSQASALYLGRIYLKQQKYQEAVTSYLEASNAEDAEIRQEALVQLTRIYARQGYYSEAIQYGRDFLTEFPEGDAKTEISEILAQSYLRTSNYRLAVELLQDDARVTSTQKRVYQAVTLRLALQYYNDAAFEEAQKWFLESVQDPLDGQLKEDSYYYLGEIHLRKENYKEAENNYLKSSVHQPEVQYGLGYVHYNQQNYSKAIPYFNQARSTAEDRIRTDAIVRLADCYYATKQYDQALGLYGVVGKIRSDPYINFQTGVTLVAAGRDREALTVFSGLKSTQAYADEAYFQIGSIHMKATRFAEASATFGELIRNFPESVLVPASLLNRGICHTNLNAFEEAESDYQQILSSHMASEEAFNALLGLQELERQGYQVARLEYFMNEYKQANPESNSVQVIEYEAAKQAYFSERYDVALRKLKNYTDSYPAAADWQEATFYLGEAQYRLGKFNEAKSTFQEISRATNDYTGRVLTRLGELSEMEGDYREAIVHYRTLADLNLTAKDNYRAYAGLLQSYFKLEEFEETIKVAGRISSLPWLPIEAPGSVKLVKAKAHLELGNDSTALDLLYDLAEGTDVFAAEAQYLIGYIAFDEANYDASLETLFSLNERHGGYTEWVEKSYLLIGKNYLEKGDDFQAKATFRSIVQHAQLDEIREEAGFLLNQLEVKNAKVDTTKEAEK